MKIAILGSGMVGQNLGAALSKKGHDVVLGTRSPDQLDNKRGNNPSLREWLAQAGPNARVASLSAAAAFGDVIINATNGTGAIEALRLAGEKNLAGKIVIDIANPLDFSKGMPPTLFVCNDDSLGEQIQRAFPAARVVKTLNTTNTSIMTDPGRLAGGDHTMFVCGNDADAKREVTQYLQDWFGWKDIIDLGDISNARGTEMLLPIWIRLLGVLGTPAFNFKIVR